MGLTYGAGARRTIEEGRSKRLNTRERARRELLREHRLAVQPARPALGEREIFGTVRYMSSGGLERKVDRLVAEARAAGVRFERD